jgi:Nif-specific regulatory protein
LTLTGKHLKKTEKRRFDESAGLREELSKRYDFSRIIGDSGPMQQVYEQIAQIACTRTTILVTGESGTGKELVADALHINSPRAGNPFIKVNCAALPESLLESELFGHERGSFTDAGARRIGRFELADSGTLFLDEIGELSPSAQVKLLRVLQHREFERIGGTQTIKVDVRVIAATNRDLEKDAAAGCFSAALYYRLNLFPISVPPLRERREDILPLAEHFLAKFSRNQGHRRFSSHAVDLLTSYDWPGNVRELENAVERAMVVADGKVVQHYHLPPTLQILRPAHFLAGENLFTAVENYEKELILTALQTTRGRRNQAAELLGISDRVLSYKIKKHKIDCEKFR